MDAQFFASADEFRAWLEEHHATAREVFVGMVKKGADQPGITHREALDLALAYGWIDGRANRIDAQHWRIRFTPRRKGSNWSAVNIKRVGELIEAGLMHPAGLAAFALREEHRSAVYSYEQAPRVLGAPLEATFRRQPQAWAFYERQAPSYRRVACYWVMTAKQEQTRQRRLAVLIDESARGRRLDLFTARRRRDSAPD
jgi:uncharacterized protein YdeI (YjbR/CyaY-like superfamily)